MLWPVEATFLVLLWNQSQTRYVSVNQTVSLLQMVTAYLVVLVALLLYRQFL